MNSDNRKTRDHPRLLLSFSDRLDFKKGINMLLYQVLAYIIQKYEKVVQKP